MSQNQLAQKVSTSSTNDGLYCIDTSFYKFASKFDTPFSEKEKAEKQSNDESKTKKSSTKK